MTVKELMDQLKLAKNKEAEVVFRVDDQSLTIDVMAEVVKDGDVVRFPVLGEQTNAIAIKLEGYSAPSLND